MTAARTVDIVAGVNAGRKLSVDDVGRIYVTGRVTCADGVVRTAFVARCYLDPDQASELVAEEDRIIAELEQRIRGLHRVGFLLSDKIDNEAEAKEAAKARQSHARRWGVQ